MELTMKATKSNCRALKAFYEHRLGAKKRGIPFLMSFAEWQWVWLASGKWEQRGIKGNQYCMARLGPDIGPYAVGNVVIKTQTENRREAGPGFWSEESREALRQLHAGKKKSKTTRRRMRRAAMKRKAHLSLPDRSKPVVAEGVRYSSLTEAGRAHGVSRTTVLSRIRKGRSGYGWWAESV